MPHKVDTMKVTNIGHSDAISEEVEQFLTLWNDENNTIHQYTSGSTGKPKLIEIPKWKMTVSAQMTGNFLNLEQCTTALLCISPQYIGGKMMIVRAITYDLELFTTDITSNPLKNLNSPIDLLAMVPLQVEETLKRNPEKLSFITHLIIGGAPVSDSLIQELAKLKCNAYSTFGMTETVSHIALRQLKNIEEPYKAIGSTTFSSDDGRLVIHSKELKINHLKTNDVIELIDEKTFHWLGRSDFVINSGGIKIHPEKVEQKIASIIHSDDFIISQIPDKKLGSKVIFIGTYNLDRESLKEEIKNSLHKYECPKSFYFLPSLIRTSSGKIDRIKTRLEINGD